MHIHIATDAAKLEKAFDRKAALIRTAIAQGLNDGGNKTRTQVQRALREQTSLLRLSSVTKRVATFPASPASLEYCIVVKGKPNTKPDEFKTTASRGPGGGVTSIMWGVAHRFKRSFVTAKRGMLRARLGDPRMPIRSFDGPNLAKEAVKPPTSTTFETVAFWTVPYEVEKRLAKLLG